MIVDTEHQRFVLPEDKAADLLQLTDNIMHSTQVSNRQLAQLAGKMIAAAPAFQLSKLFAASLYKAMVRETSWDTVYPSSEAMKADLECFSKSILASDGGNFWKRSNVLLVAGDASEYAFATFTPRGEFSHPMVVTFSEQEQLLMAQNEYSSTLREIICILKTVKVGISFNQHE